MATSDSFLLLHTNDFHNHLTEGQAATLQQLRQAVALDGLLLDAGDAVGSGNITFRPGGEPILDRMAQAGYDAMTVGNREFHFSQLGFETKLSRATFPILCANLRTARAAAGDAESVLLPVRPYVNFETPGWRVLVFGLTVPMITERMLSRKVSAYLFDDPIQTAARLVPTLRSRYQPDLLVALTHIGIKQDRALAESVPGIDVIIGGHTHVVLEEGERVGKTLIAQAGSFGRFYGRVAAKRAARGGPLELRASLEAL